MQIFFGRLEQVYPEHNLNQYLSRLRPLWEGLEQWSKQNKPEIGLFSVECLGHMPHVGISKSQVILTAKKIDRTPELFHELALSPEGNVTAGKLRELIVKEFDGKPFLLGKHIFREISNESGLGLSAIAQLLEHLEQWDGEVPVREQNGRGGTEGSGSGRAFASLVMGLEYLGDVKSWEQVIVARTPDLSDGQLSIRVGNDTFVSLAREGVSGTFENLSDRSSGPLSFSDLENMPLFITLTWQSEYEGEQEQVARIESVCPIRCLNWVNGKLLVQQQSLPSEGNVFVLVDESVADNFQHWCDNANVSTNHDLPQAGLPSGARLIHLKGIGNVAPDDWARFPDGGDEKRRRRPRRLRLFGGSRQRITGAARIYLPFDPPKIRLEADGDVSFEVTGCTVHEVENSTALPDWVDSTGISRVFEVEPELGVSKVVVQANRGVELVGKVSFRLLNREDLEPVTESEYQVNSLGIRDIDAEEGVCGVVTPSIPGFEYEEGPFDFWNSATWDKNSDCYLFLDWLAAQRTVPYAKLKSFCLSKFSKSLSMTDLSNEIKAFFKLGHLEIQVDKKGRWSYVHATRPTLYPLPYLADGKYQFVLSGTYTTGNVNQILDYVENQNELFVDIHPQLGERRERFGLLPDRFSIMSADVNEIVNLGRATDIQILDSPPA